MTTLEEFKKGKISKIDIKVIDGEFRLFVEFSMNGAGFNDAIWKGNERNEEAFKIMKNISKYLDQTKKESFKELKEVPVEVELDNNNNLLSWRILTELK